LLLQSYKLCEQIVPILGVLEVQRDAIHRAHFYALRRIEMSYALGTFVRINFVDVDPLVNSLVWTLGLTDVTIDALIGDF
jgi:type III secretory pathway component EscR